MKEIIIKAASVDEAIKIAMQKLNCPKEQLGIKILCEGQSGLFGMSGAKPTKIKARIVKRAERKTVS